MAGLVPADRGATQAEEVREEAAEAPEVAAGAVVSHGGGGRR